MHFTKSYGLPLAFQNARETDCHTASMEEKHPETQQSYDKMLIDRVRSSLTGIPVYLNGSQPEWSLLTN